MIHIPLFPLNTVLFPGGPLQLRVFEPRYLDMVSNCMQRDSGFGVCLIQEGSETGKAAVPQPVGTLARIVDWEQRRDGLLGITVIGETRFRIRQCDNNPAQLLICDADPLPEEPSSPLPEEYEPLRNLLRRIFEQLGGAYDQIEPDYEDAQWVSWRLAEILPLPLTAKQELLETDAPLERLASIQRLIQREPVAKRAQR